MIPAASSRGLSDGGSGVGESVACNDSRLCTSSCCLCGNRWGYVLSVVDLVDFIGEQEEKIQQIEDRQHEIYRESSSRKRSIKNEEQYREYQIWHMEVQEELDELKQEKRNVKR